MYIYGDFFEDEQIMEWVREWVVKYDRGSGEWHSLVVEKDGMYLLYNTALGWFSYGNVETLENRGNENCWDPLDVIESFLQCPRGLAEEYEFVFWDCRELVRKSIEEAELNWDLED